MQMSSRKEASVARVDQVGGSRREAVNKDRFSYEGHWFNGAHIHTTPGRVRSLEGRFTFVERGQKPFSSLGRRVHTGWPLSPSFLFTEPWPPRSTPRPIHLHFRPSGSRPPVRDSLLLLLFLRERERFRSSLRSEGSTIIVQICGSSWLMGYYRFKEVERWSDHFFSFQFDKKVYIHVPTIIVHLYF